MSEDSAAVQALVQLRQSNVTAPAKQSPVYIGKKRTWNGSAWGDWTQLTLPAHLVWRSRWGHDIGRGSIDSRPFVVPLARGGFVHIWPGFMAEGRREQLKSAFEQCTLWRQYKAGAYEEPRVHVLLGRNPGEGYRYNNVFMKAERVSEVPEVDELLRDVEGLLGGTFNIGVDIIVYRDGNDSVGAHADDTQGEHRIFCVVIEAEAPRDVVLRANKPFRPGDEEFHLCFHEGDAYSFDRLSQLHYLHAVPKQEAAGRRMCAILREGDTLVVPRDSGVPARALLDKRPEESGARFGHLPGLTELGIYKRTDLIRLGAHRADRRGVSGNKAEGADAVVLSWLDPSLAQHDRLVWVTYTTSARQGGGAMLQSMVDRKVIRVFRSSNLGLPFGPVAPTRTGAAIYRYDGVYCIAGAWDEFGRPITASTSCCGAVPGLGPLVTFRLVRCGSFDASNSSNGGSSGRSNSSSSVNAERGERRHCDRCGCKVARQKYLGSRSGSTGSGSSSCASTSEGRELRERGDGYGAESSDHKDSYSASSDDSDDVVMERRSLALGGRVGNRSYLLEQGETLRNGGSAVVQPKRRVKPACRCSEPLPQAAKRLPVYTNVTSDRELYENINRALRSKLLPAVPVVALAGDESESLVRQTCADLLSEAIEVLTTGTTHYSAALRRPIVVTRAWAADSDACGANRFWLRCSRCAKWRRLNPPPSTPATAPQPPPSAPLIAPADAKQLAPQNLDEIPESSAAAPLGLPEGVCVRNGMLADVDAAPDDALLLGRRAGGLSGGYETPRRSAAVQSCTGDHHLSLGWQAPVPDSVQLPPLLGKPQRTLRPPLDDDAVPARDLMPAFERSPPVLQLPGAAAATASLPPPPLGRTEAIKVAETTSNLDAIYADLSRNGEAGPAHEEQLGWFACERNLWDPVRAACGAPQEAWQDGERRKTTGSKPANTAACRGGVKSLKGSSETAQLLPATRRKVAAPHVCADRGAAASEKAIAAPMSTVGGSFSANVESAIMAAAPMVAQDPTEFPNAPLGQFAATGVVRASGNAKQQRKIPIATPQPPSAPMERPRRERAVAAVAAATAKAAAGGKDAINEGDDGGSWSDDDEAPPPKRQKERVTNGLQSELQVLGPQESIGFSESFSTWTGRSWAP